MARYTRPLLLTMLAAVLLLPTASLGAGAPSHAKPSAPPAPGAGSAPNAPSAPSMPGAPSDPSQPNEVSQPSQPAQPAAPGAPGHGTVADPGAPGAPGSPGHATVGDVSQPGAPGQPGAVRQPAMVQALNDVKMVARGGIQEVQQVLGPKSPVPVSLAPFAMGDMGLGQAPMHGMIEADLQGLGYQAMRTQGGDLIIASCASPGKSQVLQLGADGSYASAQVPANSAKPPAAPYVKTAAMPPGQASVCQGAMAPLPGLPWTVAAVGWDWNVEKTQPGGAGLAAALGMELGAATGLETELVATGAAAKPQPTKVPAAKGANQ